MKRLSSCFSRSPATTSRPEVPARALDRNFPDSLCALLTRTWQDNHRHGRWKRRWIAASGTVFSAVMAFALGGISWRTVVMIAGATFIFAMSGDMLDRVQE